MGMDATAPAGFSAERASLSPDAVERAGRILHGGDG
jgi:hypothetical protein